MKEFWAKHKATIGLGILVLYVVVLGVATADEVFSFGLFPTKLDRMICESIEKMQSPDAVTREEGKQEILEYGDFSVPQLIDALDEPEPLKGLALECLAEVSNQEFGTDTTIWKNWYKDHKDEF